MFYTPVTSLNQPLSIKRSNKKRFDLDSLPHIDPYLISIANADARRQLCRQSRLDAYALVCLVHFAWAVAQRLSEIKKNLPGKRYVYGRTSIAADLRAAYRLQSLREYHRHSLSQQAVNTITEALCWYNDLCLEMRKRRERERLFGLAAN